MNEPFRHRELDEVLGELHHIEASQDGGIVALIGKIPTWLPSELEARLRGLIGRRVGVLKLDGYHVHCLDKEEVHPDSNRQSRLSQ